jgi:hypothetical protein
LRRYREHGLAGLVDQSRRPKTSPGQTAAEVEAVICELPSLSTLGESPILT